MALYPRSKREILKQYLWLDNKSTIVHTISCGFEFVMVASGKLEGRIMMDPFGKDWDYAPGSLLVEQAGGIVRNIGSDDYDYTNHNALMTNVVIGRELAGRF